MVICLQSYYPPDEREEWDGATAPELTEGLYGESFVSSVSRIESYYSCPFQHYASFGLGLRERTEFTLEAPAIGDLFHAALKWVSDETMRLGKSWAELTRKNVGSWREQQWRIFLRISSIEFYCQRTVMFILNVS